MAYALVTGATGGIGSELCDILASHGHSLVLVARNEEKLESLARKLIDAYGIEAATIPCNLAEPGAADILHQATVDAGIAVDFLANNAGFGDQGAFLDASWERQDEMVRLNVLALMRLSYLYGRDMRTAGTGRILNVASVAAFAPGPYMSTYFASKAFVLSFSQALGEELAGTGVSVTALCPGTTATGFWEAAGMSANKVFSLMAMASPRDVAELGYEAAMSRRPVALHGVGVKLANIGSRIAPRRFATWLMGKVLARRSGA